METPRENCAAQAQCKAFRQGLSFTLQIKACDTARLLNQHILLSGENKCACAGESFSRMIVKIIWTRCSPAVEELAGFQGREKSYGDRILAILDCSCPRTAIDAKSEIFCSKCSQLPCQKRFIPVQTSRCNTVDVKQGTGLGYLKRRGVPRGEGKFSGLVRRIAAVPPQRGSRKQLTGYLAT